jgi:tetratricopeptide (TPR) repeat protein/tRNA A-37 threonylcarbamoyl transferase component Bud32
MTEDVQHLQALFAAAVELPPELRAQMLARECASNPQLLAELEALLEADFRFHGTTAQPIASGLTKLIPPLVPQAELIGARVGPYELREEIGRGGMGTVFRAERVDGSVAQQVAIKFVRRELLDANTLKRFQLERQLMAALNHPFIARLLDAAQLDDGTPYYVMEFVDGIPITEYCARKGLDARGRVSLMRKVCGAVAEAHRELIVHRDLKPSNILVDSAGNPKLLDFGIAKPLSASLEANEETGTAHRYFSPQYAAPEQLISAPVGVACDVYGLGLLLYELLAECRPFDLTGLSAGQIERLIKDVPPAAPSSARARDGNANICARQLRGDLDDIVMRCLRKLPSERYASVEKLEADLGNYLDGRPVQACGGHGWYRAQKFILRNKVAVSAAALVLLSMLFSIAAFAWQARIAQQRAAELEQVSKFQADMLAQVDTVQAGKLLSDDVRAKFDEALRNAGVADSERTAQTEAFAKLWQRVNTTDAARDLIDSTILKPAAEAIDKQFKDQPVIDAALRQVLAARYLDIGLYDAALPLQERALATRRSVLGDEHSDTLKSLYALADLLSAQGKLADAEVVFREAVEKRRRILGEEHPDTLTSIDALGMVLMYEAKWIEAERCVREALEKRRRVLGDQHGDTMHSINNMGGVLQHEGKLREAEPYFREVLDKRRRFLGEDDPDTLSSINNLGLLLKEQGKLSEAEPYFREALVKNRRVLGEEHPDVLPSISNMGLLLEAQGKLDEAEPYYREALEKARRVLGEEHQTTLILLNHMGRLLLAQGKPAEAEPYDREALEKARRVLGDEHPSTLIILSNMGSLWLAEGKPGDCAALLAPAEAAMRKEFTGEYAHRLAKYLVSLGMARTALGQYADAEANLIEARDILAASLYPKDLRDCTHALADLYTAWNKAQPSKGYEAKAAEWARNAHEADPKLPPAATPVKAEGK